MAQKRKRNPSVPLPAVAVSALIVIAVLVITLGGSKKAPDRTAEVAEGTAFLTSLEQKDPNVVRQARQALYQRRMAEKKAELTEQIKKGEVDPFPFFEDYILMGDSRAIGFYYSEFLAKENVIATGGHTILAIEGKLPELAARQPSYVFLTYGLNDVSIGYWDTGEEHAKLYMEKIKMIQEILPDATIVVSSILPTTDAAYSVSSRWKKIPEWNKALKAACEENGILFADCDWVYEEHKNLWVSDGQHFRPALYPYWGGQLIITALYGEVGNEA